MACPEGSTSEAGSAQCMSSGGGCTSSVATLDDLLEEMATIAAREKVVHRLEHRLLAAKHAASHGRHGAALKNIGAFMARVIGYGGKPAAHRDYLSAEDARRLLCGSASVAVALLP